MRVLLTGATGFVGSRLARVLVQDGHEVHALVRAGADRRRIAGVEASLHVVDRDLRDGAGVAADVSRIRPELCVHAAWYAEPGAYLHASENLDHLVAAVELARALAAAGCRRLVGVGTCFEYDTRLGRVSEESPTDPDTIYSASKVALFHVLARLCERAGMEFAWPRIFYLYGPFEDERRLVPSVVLALLRGRPARTTPGEQRRDFLHVDDVAAAIAAVALSGVGGPVNVGSGGAVAIRDVVSSIAEIVGRPDLLELGALPAAPGDPPLVEADNRRLIEEVGWSPRFTLDEGLGDTVEWWRARA